MTPAGPVVVDRGAVLVRNLVLGVFVIGACAALGYAVGYVLHNGMPRVYLVVTRPVPDYVPAAGD